MHTKLTIRRKRSSKVLVRLIKRYCPIKQLVSYKTECKKNITSDVDFITDNISTIAQKLSADE